jgi:Cft2 family RNA processing exonuclease
MFHYDGGLKLTRADLAVDFRRRMPRAFVSHAHNDHMARHELALCTPATGRLYHHRLGVRPVLELPYREPREWGGLRLTTYPAGHCLGSAMLLAEDGELSLLYTGDFKLARSATSEQAELPRADILVLESTYGDPHYRFAKREALVAELVDVVHQVLADGRTPVIEAYALGKAQEVTRLLTDHGVPVLQHRSVYEISVVYEQCGMALGRFAEFTGLPLEGHALVVPPGKHRGAGLQGVRRPFRIAVTGWALGGGASGAGGWSRRFGVDHAVPLSDHADFDELLEAVARVGAREIYCTHGPKRFVDELRKRGFNARRLEEPVKQANLTLF